MGTAEENKRIACAYFNMFLGGRHDEAFRAFIGENYVQHNPFVSGEPGATLPYVKKLFASMRNPRADVKRVLSDGDLVAIHHHFTSDDNPRGIAVVDIMRLENGKIVEHWDVIQEVAEHPANHNTMF